MISTLIEWNQTFSFNVTDGSEKVLIKLKMYSISLGDILIDKVEFSLDDILPKLGD